MEKILASQEAQDLIMRRWHAHLGIMDISVAGLTAQYLKKDLGIKVHPLEILWWASEQSHAIEVA